MSGDPGRTLDLPTEWWAVRYAKRRRMRFASHRDVQRAMERAVRRADVPVALSSGFHPHPRISYVGAVPTGVASEAEYLEIGLAAKTSAMTFLVGLGDSLPDGLDVVDAVRCRKGLLAGRLQASTWRVETDGVPTDALAAGIKRVLGADQLIVDTATKSGPRPVDVVPRIVEIVDRTACDDGMACETITMTLTHGSPSVRASDVLAAIWRAAGVAPTQSPRITRLAQGPLKPGSRTLGDALAQECAGTKPAGP